ncbi:MAG: hypothetical protein EOO02_18265 [Chitinophagaceae bacterium]|nr:MAG: hypothetical protein EOO02_18265 [Chitinophagaceae bacterium]
MLPSTVFSQDVKVKKDEVLLDGKAFLNYEKLTIVEYSIKDVTGNEFLSLQIKESPTTHASYLVLYFTEAKRRIESTSIDRISGMGSKTMIEKLITWLLKDKVLNADGTINPEKLEVFSEKYNDYK